MHLLVSAFVIPSLVRPIIVAIVIQCISSSTLAYRYQSLEI
jgi:hypothetical protein